MSLGVAIYNAAGSLVMQSPDEAGGVFVSAHDLAIGASGTLTFPKCVAGGLRVLQYQAGNHFITVGVNGSNEPTVTYTAYAGVNNIPARASGIAVFAVDNVLDPFGMYVNNAVGARVFDSTFPKPEYLGKIALSGTFTSTVPESGYSQTTYTAGPVSLGNTRKRLILYDFQEGADLWWTRAQGYFAAGLSVTPSIMAVYPTGSSGWSAPYAYVFALDDLSPSGGWGLQVFDAAGAMTFESSKNHLFVRTMTSGIEYPDVAAGSVSAPNSYALPTLATSPAAYFHPFDAIWWQGITAFLSIGHFYSGAMRRSGSTLYTRIMEVDGDSLDTGGSSFLKYGPRSNIVLPTIDTALYG